jgi:hypothetical protein
MSHSWRMSQIHNFLTSNPRRADLYDKRTHFENGSQPTVGPDSPRSRDDIICMFPGLVRGRTGSLLFAT